MASSISDALSSTSGSNTAAATGSNRFNELTSEDFVKIMFTELSNQDPLKPNDSNTLLQQFSSLRNIEADLSMQTKLTAVVSQSQLATAGTLLGKYVTGYNEYFDPAEGIVKSISQTSDGPVLNLASGSRIPFKNIDQILEAPTTTPTPPGTTPPTTPPATPPDTTRPPLPQH